MGERARLPARDRRPGDELQPTPSIRICGLAGRMGLCVLPPPEPAGLASRGITSGYLRRLSGDACAFFGVQRGKLDGFGGRERGADRADAAFGQVCSRNGRFRECVLGQRHYNGDIGNAVGHVARSVVTRVRRVRLREVVLHISPYRGWQWIISLGCVDFPGGLLFRGNGELGAACQVFASYVASSCGTDGVGAYSDAVLEADATYGRAGRGRNLGSGGFGDHGGYIRAVEPFVDVRRDVSKLAVFNRGQWINVDFLPTRKLQT